MPGGRWEPSAEHAAAVRAAKGLSGESDAEVVEGLRLAYGQVYRAVAFDIDGTLTDEAGTTMDSVLARVVCDLLERGVPVVLITGRGRQGARVAAAELLKAGGLSRLQLGRARWAQVKRRLLCVTHNGVFLLTATSGSAAAAEDDGDLLPYEHAIEAVRTEASEWYEQVRKLLASEPGLEGLWAMGPEPEPAGVRVRFRSPEARGLAVPLVERWMPTVGEERLHITLGTYRGDAMLDVGTASKGAAVGFVAEHLDVRPDAILRVGDQGELGGNDFTLLASSAGFSVDRFSPDPRACFPVLDDENLVQARGAAAVRLLLSRVNLFPRMMIRPQDWTGYRRRLARFEDVAIRHSRTQQGLLIRQVNVRLQSLMAHRTDGGLEEVRLTDLFDPRSGAVRLTDHEVDRLVEDGASPSAPRFDELFGLALLRRETDADRGPDWCMHSDTEVLLRGPAYYRSLSGPREDASVAGAALEEWAAFADKAAEVITALADRPDDPSLLHVKCVVGVMDNVRGALLQAIVIALILDGEHFGEALPAARQLVTAAALPHTEANLGLLLQTSLPWPTLLRRYLTILDSAGEALRDVARVLASAVPTLRPDVEWFKWREADHLLENVAAVEVAMRRTVPVAGDGHVAPWAVGLAFGGVELPLLAKVLGDQAGRPVRPAVLRLSMYSDKPKGRQLRNLVLEATDAYLGLLDQQAPFLTLDQTATADDVEPLHNQTVLLLDDNTTTATTLTVARDLALYRGAQVLGACLVRFPSPNRVAHMQLEGHGALDLDLVFNVVWGLVAPSPYSRLTVPGDTEKNLYEDENGVFDKAKQRIKYLLRKNDPAGPAYDDVLPKPRAVTPRTGQGEEPA